MSGESKNPWTTITSIVRAVTGGALPQESAADRAAAEKRPVTHSCSDFSSNPFIRIWERIRPGREGTAFDTVWAVLTFGAVFVLELARIAIVLILLWFATQSLLMSEPVPPPRTLIAIPVAFLAVLLGLTSGLGVRLRGFLSGIRNVLASRARIPSAPSAT